jgi:hypothetical protein
VLTRAGTAPLQINGRAAMIGLLCAINGEVYGRGHPSTPEQFHSLGGGLAFLFVAGVMTVATFAPDIQRAVGAEYESSGAVARIDYTSNPATRSMGIFTPKAEMTNGRAASACPAAR